MVFTTLIVYIMAIIFKIIILWFLVSACASANRYLRDKNSLKRARVLVDGKYINHTPCRVKLDSLQFYKITIKKNLIRYSYEITSGKLSGVIAIDYIGGKPYLINPANANCHEFTQQNIINILSANFAH